MRARVSDDGETARDKASAGWAGRFGGVFPEDDSGTRAANGTGATIAAARNQRTPRYGILRALVVLLLSVFGRPACGPSCFDDLDYHEVDLVRWCSDHAVCEREGTACPSAGCDPRFVAESDRTVVSVPFSEVDSQVDLESVYFVVSRLGPAPSFSLYVYADEVPVCQIPVDDDVVTATCSVSAGTSILVVNAPLAHPSFYVDIWARERAPTKRIEVCGG